VDVVPYGWAFAALCVLQGALVAAAAAFRPIVLGRSRLVGLGVPLAVFLVGLAATRGASWSTEAVAHLATFGTLAAAGALGVVARMRPAWPPLVVAPLLWLVAWRADGLPADLAGVTLVAGACLTLGLVIAAATPPWALAAGLVVLAVVDAVLVFTDQVGPGARALHAVIPFELAGDPLPALQDATLDRARFGWLDILAPVLAGTLVARRPERWLAAGLTALAALALGLLLAVADSVPGTVPPLAAVAVWLAIEGAARGRRPAAFAPP
jgi:hypothetical protein